MAKKSYEEKMRDVVARQDIHNLLCDYMRGQDRLDPVLHRSVFFDDARVDYGFLKGGPDEFVAFAQGALKDHRANQHVMGQMDIRIEGDVGFGEIYYIAYHRIIVDGQDKDLFICGRYIDRYECRDGEWKIAFRSELCDWARLDPAADSFMASFLPDALMGARGAADPSSDREALRHR